MGFIIRDPNGITLFTRMPGVTYYANTIFGSFCPSCLNYADVRIAYNPYDSSTKDELNKYSDSSYTSQPDPVSPTTPTTSSSDQTSIIVKTPP